MSIYPLVSSVAVAVLVAACNAPGPHFRGLEATRITIEGSTFDVRVQNRLAEANRMNREYAPRLGPIAQRAARAMQLVSGCDVTQVRGDAAQITGILDCGEGPPPTVLVIGLNYECQADGRFLDDAIEPQFADYDCEPVPY